jgi:hypothetical protein
MMRAISFVAMVLLVAALAACDRTHQWSSYGQSLRRALKAQVIDPGAGDRPSRGQGLDPEEAGIVAKAYRESLSPRKEDQPHTPVVVLPTTPSGAPMPLSSSPR